MSERFTVRVTGVDTGEKDYTCTFLVTNIDTGELVTVTTTQALGGKVAGLINACVAVAQRLLKASGAEGDIPGTSMSRLN